MNEFISNERTLTYHVSTQHGLYINRPHDYPHQ